MKARADDSEELPSSISKTLTDEEIVSLCVDFLLSGYETTTVWHIFPIYILTYKTNYVK